MGREIKRFIIGSLISAGIHITIFSSPIFLTPALNVQEIPGSIEVSLGVQWQPLEERLSTQAKKTKQVQQRVEAKEFNPSPQAEDQIKAQKVEDDTPGKRNPDRSGDSSLAVPRHDGNPKPPYPEVARRRGYEGHVRLKVEVLVSGKVGRIWVTQSSGYEVLDRSALNTVKDWSFIPAQFGGIPQKSTVIVPITFQLKD